MLYDTVNSSDLIHNQLAFGFTLDRRTVPGRESEGSWLTKDSYSAPPSSVRQPHRPEARFDETVVQAALPNSILLS